jgi:hypothetical protein
VTRSFRQRGQAMFVHVCILVFDLFDCRCRVAVTVVEFVIFACVCQIQSVETRDMAHRDVHKLGLDRDSGGTLFASSALLQVPHS